MILWTLSLSVAFSLPIFFDAGLRGWHRFPAEPAWEVKGGDAIRGRNAILLHGCGGCHTIPGIRSATGRVGPQLAGLRDQLYIAGMLPNTPENLIAWILNPREINPHTAMPNLRLTESEARDIAAYLFSNP